MLNALALFWLVPAASAACDVVVQGIVVDGDTGAPIAGAALVIGPLGRLSTATSTEDGRFVAGGQCAGLVRIEASHPDFHATATAGLAEEFATVQLYAHEDYEVVVTESAPLGLQDTRAAVTLGEAELDEGRGDDLAGTLSRVPGVTSLGGASSTSKPMVRGQFGQRVLILVDRVRHEGQKWGIDHAPEIDAFGAQQITVIRGAAGVRYGSDAIGGVILVDPEPMREAPGTTSSMHAVAGSNGLRGSLAARVDTMSVAVPGLAVRLSANATSAADRTSPNYVLGNTASREVNLGAAVGYASDRVHARVSWDRYDLENGVFFGSQQNSPESLQLGATRDPVGADTWTVSRRIDDPRQRVVHDRVIGRLGVDTGGAGHLDLTLSYQHNHRIEQDVVRDSFTGPQFDFTLRTTALDAAYGHEPLPIGLDATLEGAVGLTGQLQENVYRGLPLVPNYRAYSGGVYAWERLWRRRAAVEVGARLDQTSRTAYLTEGGIDRLDRRGVAADCARTDSGARCAANWTAATVTAGALWGSADDVLDVKFDLSSGTRTPTIDEQFLDGTAPTFPAFALGDPTLGIETTYTAGAVTHVHTTDLHGEISPFASYVDDYIQFAPAVGVDGQPVFDVVSRGAFPRFTTSAVNATWYGVDGSLELAPERVVSVDLRGSMVRGQQTDGTPLAFVPPDRAGLSLTGHGPDRGSVHGAYLAMDVDAVAKQKRTAPGDFAPPPAGVVLLGARVGGEVRFASSVLRLSGELRNLTNARYRTYTSLLRYYGDEPGRDAIVRASLHVNI